MSIHHPESFPYPKLKFSANYARSGPGKSLCDKSNGRPRDVTPLVAREDKRGGILKNSHVPNQTHAEKRNVLAKCDTSLHKSETAKTKLACKKGGGYRQLGVSVARQ